ncbi:hypothetical protein BCV69DRAFT_9217 [Microstroma glucosiphilum]|uniref:Uncharacterized protein n=1 Tax=Pseudomicrostroma glucosiphilum TaxID=1684307 RepID=A0A316UEU4_9BASI|nr:hypothetical protein BCV69DRAFT_9217 [Pseudomicrostroma glucosiphilum]PWN23766.1 hypothetical protein BCV69DRAFT_9217 [Pseudomicrostroma glucosiphilum]
MSLNLPQRITFRRSYRGRHYACSALPRVDKGEYQRGWQRQRAVISSSRSESLTYTLTASSISPPRTPPPALSEASSWNHYHIHLTLCTIWLFTAPAPRRAEPHTGAILRMLRPPRQGLLSLQSSTKPRGRRKRAGRGRRRARGTLGQAFVAETQSLYATGWAGLACSQSSSCKGRKRGRKAAHRAGKGREGSGSQTFSPGTVGGEGPGGSPVGGCAERGERGGTGFDNGSNAAKPGEG